MNRTDFLKTSARATLGIAGAALITDPLEVRAFITPKKAQKYRTAVVGTGWWGGNIMLSAIQAGESQIVALCDVDSTPIQYG